MPDQTPLQFHVATGSARAMLNTATLLHQVADADIMTTPAESVLLACTHILGVELSNALARIAELERVTQILAAGRNEVNR